jgi:adenylylsulfate kinase-like enzyme
VYTNSSLDICKKRDIKGLYAKAELGQLVNFTGISAPYEEPTNALVIDTEHNTMAQSLDNLDIVVLNKWQSA